MAEDKEWYWLSDSHKIDNLERMPIHHKIGHHERKHIQRRPRNQKSRGESQNPKVNGLPLGVSDGKRQMGNRNKNEKSLTDFDVHEDSDSDKEDKHLADAIVCGISQKVYLEACKKCHVAPGRSIVKNLESAILNMHASLLGPEDVKALAYALTANSTVSTLDLSGNDIGRDGIFNVVRMLLENATITCLNVSNNNLGPPGAVILGQLIEESDILQSLEASGNNFGDEEAECFANALQHNIKLRKLDLSHNNFQEKGGVVLAKTLGHSSLHELNLSWNHLRMSGAVAFSDALKCNDDLRVLNVAWNGFSNEGAQSLADALKVNRCLQELDLTSNRIGYQGCKHLAESLKANNTLQSLSVSRNPVTTCGATELLTAVQENEECGLERLELEEIPILLDTETIIQNIRVKRPQFSVIYGGFVRSIDFIALVSIKNSTPKERNDCS